MSLRINHNILAMSAHRNVMTTQRSLDSSLLRLSSGQRINSAADDPAGLAISEKMRAQISSMEQAMRNGSDAINLLQTAEGALSVIDEKLIRLRSLAIEASNGTLVSADRTLIDTEFQALLSEITRIASVTEFNGQKLIDGTFSSGTGIKFHIGTHNVQNQDFWFQNIGDMTSSGLGISALDVTTTANSQAALATIDSAIHTKDNERTELGSSINRLQNTLMNLEIAWENASAAESTIRDADIGLEMSAFVRAQMLQQTGISMLAQANMMPQIVSQLVG